MSMIIYGQQGRGAFAFEKLLMRHFGFSEINYSWKPGAPLPDNVLAFTTTYNVKGAVHWLDAIETMVSSTLNQQELLKEWVSLRDFTLKPVVETIVEIRLFSGPSAVIGYEVVTTKQTIHLSVECEDASLQVSGCFFCNKDYRNFVGAELLFVSLGDRPLNGDFMIWKALNEICRKKVFYVNIETNLGTLQFVAFSKHSDDQSRLAKVETALMTHSQIL